MDLPPTLGADMPRHYLFIDEVRLDSYIQQISSGTTYDKIEVWSTGLKLTGPEVSGMQQRLPRKLTSHEKIELFLTSLKANIEERSASNRFMGDEMLVRERLSAKQFIFARNPKSSLVAGLTVWVVESKHSLILLQGPLPAEGHTRFSAFTEFCFDFEATYQSPLILPGVRQAPYDKEAHRQFIQEPWRLLEKAGATCTGIRHFEVVYFRRYVSFDSETVFRPISEDEVPPEVKSVTYGYPVFIAETHVPTVLM